MMTTFAGTAVAAAVLLVVSGVAKLRAPVPTQAALRNAGLPGSRPLARTVGGSEVALGAAALALGGPVWIAALALAYGALTVFSLRLLARSGGRADCGCFGGASSPISIVHVMVNALVTACVVANLGDPPGGFADLADQPGRTTLIVMALALVQVGLLALVLTSLPRRLAARGAGAGVASSESAGPPTTGGTISTLRGARPDGTSVEVRLVGRGGDTIVAFLSSTCTTCHEFWTALDDPPLLGLDRAGQLVVVTRDPGEERTRAVARLAPVSHPTVMSSETFDRFGVPGAPWFVRIDDATGAVAAAGTGKDWPEVAALLSSTPANAANPSGPAGGTGNCAGGDRDAV